MFAGAAAQSAGGSRLKKVPFNRSQTVWLESSTMWGPSITQLALSNSRELGGEIMDDPHLDSQRHLAALDGLARLNALSCSVRPLWNEICRLAANRNLNRLRILDIGSGSGDVPLRLWRLARQSKLKLDLVAADISGRALNLAACRARQLKAPLETRRIDVVKNGIPRGFDVVTCSLFLHHLTTEQAADLLRKMASSSQQLLLVSDLVRKNWGLWLAKFATQLFTRSDVARIDGERSVRAAFTMHEARELAARAGLRGATISRHWPCRFLLRWER